MMYLKNKKIILVFCFFISLVACGSVQEALDTIASIDSCEDTDALSPELNEACRELEGLLPDATDSLSSQTAIISVRQTTDGQYYDTVLMVTDSGGQPVDTLQVDHVVAERSVDGTSYTSVTLVSLDRYEELATTDTHLSFASIVDYSGSILDSDLADVNTGLTTLYETLPAFYRSEVVKFSTDVGGYPEDGFTTDQQELLSAVADTSFPREYTSMYDGLYEGIEDLSGETSTLKLAILFSDGGDNDSIRTYDEVKELFQRHDVPVCVVGVGFASLDILQTIASDSGCFFIYKPVFSDLDDAFTTVVGQIKNFYRIRLNTSDFNSGETLKFTVSVPGEGSSRESVMVVIP